MWRQCCHLCVVVCKKTCQWIIFKIVLKVNSFNKENITKYYTSTRAEYLFLLLNIRLLIFS